MSRVLYIKVNPKSTEESRTFQISEKFMETYRQNHPEDEVTTLDLYKIGCSFLGHDVVTMHKNQVQASKEHPILKYAFQFKEMDKYVIAAPMWNLSIPAILKAYIDYIVVAGVTFKYTEQGAKGLLENKKAAYIVTRGGEYLGSPALAYEMGERYLRTILGFLGITDFTTISADGLDIVGADVQAKVEQAITKARETAKTF
jgi:FMN-dependent NADH-azoreductase